MAGRARSYASAIASAGGAAGRSARRLDLLDHAERIAGLGSWEWTPDTNELLWSDNHFRLFGLEPGEIAPSPEYILARVHPHDRHVLEEIIRALAAAEFRDRGLEYRISRADGAVRSLRVSVATVEESGSVPRRIVGSVQDVTLERRVDRQLAAHVAVTHALDDWPSLELGAEGLLGRLATAMDLAFGAFWVPDGPSLAARAIWRLPSHALEPLVELTRRWHPGVGSATLGRAFASRQPVIVADASEGGPPGRNSAIRRAGIRGAMAVPAVSMDETLAVLEFLSFEPIEPTQRLVRALDGIGHELGHFLSHRRGELAAPVLTPREIEVLQLAAQGRSAATIAAGLYLSPATVKRHFERAYARLDVSDRAAAVGEAMRRGLIT
jgi:PAS domain S-box-containing protein